MRCGRTQWPQNRYHRLVEIPTTEVAVSTLFVRRGMIPPGLLLRRYWRWAASLIKNPGGGPWGVKFVCGSQGTWLNIDQVAVGELWVERIGMFVPISEAFLVTGGVLVKIKRNGLKLFGLG